MDGSDADALENEIYGLSAMTAPIVAAYNDDEQALRITIAISIDMLDRYEQSLSKRMTAQEREGIRGILFFGYMLNAMALRRTTEQGKAASEAAKIALDNFRKAPSAAKNPRVSVRQNHRIMGFRKSEA